MTVDAAPTPAERLQAAKHVLARAEAATGIRSRLPHAAPASLTRPTPIPGLSTPGPVSAAAGDRFLPVPDALAPLVPFGGLRRGSAVRVDGSASLLLSLAAAACREGAWCAVVGMPDLGLAAAAEHGLPLTRVALVPQPGPDAPAVLGAAIDGFDVVLLGEVSQLGARERRQLSSRLRHREAVLLTAGHWPGAELRLTATDSRWGGLGQGHGALRDRSLAVAVGGRGAAGGRGHLAVLRAADGIHLVVAAGASAAGASAMPAKTAMAMPVVPVPDAQRWAG